MTMRRDGIINARLASALAGLRHTDLFAISDSGFPTEAGVDVIDLAVVYGLPEFAPVLAAVLAEVVVEKATMATETEVHNPAQAQRLRSHFDDVAQVSHAELKALAAGAKFVVRTGEATPYANVLLQAGVAFA
jgi:D-ribose pyranase